MVDLVVGERTVGILLGRWGRWVVARINEGGSTCDSRYSVCPWPTHPSINILVVSCRVASCGRMVRDCNSVDWMPDLCRSAFARFLPLSVCLSTL